jgi:hypothetical protein
MTPPAAAVRYPGPGPDNITSGSALDALLLLHPGPTSPAAELKALRQEIMRCLKRYIAHLFRTPTAAMAVATQARLQDRT